MPCGTLLFQPTKILAWNVPFLSQMPDKPRVATNLASLLEANHVQVVPRKHVSPTRSVPLCRFVQALVVCCGCRLRLRVPLHQATGTQARLLGARDIEYHLSQSSTAPTNARLHHCEPPDTAHQQLHVHHRSFDRLAAFVRLTKPKRLSLCSATNGYCDPL